MQIYKMNKILKLLFVIFIFFNLQTSSNSKPVPPGSGQGDVPANILILLDSSLSMQNKITGGATLTFPYDIVEDEDGNQDWVFDEISVYRDPVESNITQVETSNSSGCSASSASASLLVLPILGLGLAARRRRRED